jgi:hypothetical protein
VTKSDAYYSMAVIAIGLAKTTKDLRDWWSKEAAHRFEYDLSDQQTADLIELCKARIKVIEESDGRKDDRAA